MGITAAADLPASHPQRAVLLTAAGPRMRQVLEEISLPAFNWYAARWGYHVEATTLSRDGVGAEHAAQRAKWQKIGLLREALTRYEVAVWFDADVLVQRDDEDVARHLHPHHFQAFAVEQVPAEHRINPNTGVWVLRSCASAFAFLDAVEAHGQQAGPWADQGAVLAALGWDRGDEQYRWAGPGIGSTHLRRTSWLPSSWNQPYVGPRSAQDSYNSDPASYADRPVVSRPHALHFMGLTPEARYRYMATAAVEDAERSGRYSTV